MQLYQLLNAISKPTYLLTLNWRHKRLCIRIGHYGAIQMLYYYYLFFCCSLGFGERRFSYLLRYTCYTFHSPAATPFCTCVDTEASVQHRYIHTNQSRLWDRFAHAHTRKI